MNKVNIGYKNRLFAEGLELMINGFEGYNVLHTLKYEKLHEYPSLNKNEASILVIELDIPKKSDLDLISSILETNRDLHILLISGNPSTGISGDLLNSGISSYILKSCVSSDLRTALDKIGEGKNYFCSGITGALIMEKNNHQQAGNFDQLTQREKEILILLVNNNHICEVARKLKISENTVKTHKRNIQTKLGFKNIIEMLLFAVRNNLVEVGYHDLCLTCPFFTSN